MFVPPIFTDTLQNIYHPKKAYIYLLNFSSSTNIREAIISFQFTLDKTKTKSYREKKLMPNMTHEKDFGLLHQQTVPRGSALYLETKTKSGKVKDGKNRNVIFYS